MEGLKQKLLEFAGKHPISFRILLLVVRVLLLVVYYFIAVWVMLLSRQEDGFGPLSPAAILFSWGMVAAASQLLPGNMAVLMLLLYLLGLFCLTSVCARFRRQLFSWLPFIIHGVGIIRALIWAIQNEGPTDYTPLTLVVECVIATVLVTHYLIADMLLAKAGSQWVTRTAVQPGISD